MRIESATKSNSIYDSSRLAAGYAYHRPPVHAAVLRKIRQRLGLQGKLPRALDVGCGAGLSTAALESLAEAVIGIEPVEAMLAFRHDVSATAKFVVGQAEHLPFAAQSFELMTTAGAINYADRDLFFPEAARVLTTTGVLVVYDFSAGCRSVGDDRLELWFAEFQQRYPAPPGYAMDVRAQVFDRYGLRLVEYEEFEVALPMTLDAYLAYAMSETSVEQAIQDRTPEAEIRDWCQATLSEVFGESESLEILFDAYIACVSLAEPEQGTSSRQ
ncbi:MAG: class I SAM-dependent methyltransferase [Blastocatellia bacterium]